MLLGLSDAKKERGRCVLAGNFDKACQLQTEVNNMRLVLETTLNLPLLKGPQHLQDTY